MNPAQSGFKIDSHLIYDRMARGQQILWASLTTPGTETDERAMN
jgi:hypothetical protein